MKSNIDKGFAHLGAVIYENPVKCLLVILLVVAGFLSQLPKIVVDNSLESFLSPDDPSVVTYEKFRETFGYDAVLMVGISDEALLSKEKLALIKRMHKELEEQVPNYDEINSIFNARYIYGEGDDLIVEDLIEQAPETPEQLTALKEKISSSALYRDLVISRDLELTNITIRLLGEYRDPDTGEFKTASDKEIDLVVTATKKVVEKYRGDFDSIYYAGTPAVTVVIMKAMAKDMRTFTVSSIVIIALTLLILFRRVSGVFIPLVVVVLSAGVTFSLFPIFSQVFQMPSAILPSFILAVGVGDSVHFLTHFYVKFDETNDKETAIMYAFERTGLAMLLTSLTTIAGLLSFATADLVPVANIGMFAAGGVAAAFLFTITFIPTAVRLLPIKVKSVTSSTLHTRIFHQFFESVLAFVVRFHRAIVIGFIALLAVSLYLALNIQFAHNPLSWFPPESDIRIATSTMDEKMGGTMPLEIVVQTVQEKGVQEPEFLTSLEKAQRAMEQYETADIVTGKVLTIADMLKETHQALNGNQSSFYQLPDSKEIVGSELFLLEISGADDLYRLVDRDFQQARSTIIIPWLETSLYADITKDAERIYRESFAEPVDVRVTGMIPIMGNTLTGVMHSTARSYLVAIGIISIMMVLLLSSFKYGAISMFPNIFPIAIVLAIMHLSQQPLDLFTMMIGSIALGLAVDDTVHFMHTFMNYYEKGMSTEEAISRTLHTTGRAMLTTTLVLSLGFFIYLFSTLNNLTNFGMFTGLCILLALIADFVFAPALLLMIHRDRKKVA